MILISSPLLPNHLHIINVYGFPPEFWTKITETINRKVRAYFDAEIGYIYHIFMVLLALPLIEIIIAYILRKFRQNQASKSDPQNL